MKNLIQTVFLSLVLFLSMVSFSHSAEAPTLDPLQIWIDKLQTYESQDNEQLVFLDSNNQYSKGCLQFQDWTFKHYSARYKMTGDIMDCHFQKELAYKMLIEDWKNWRHWYTSVRKKGLGYPPKM